MDERLLTVATPSDRKSSPFKIVVIDDNLDYQLLIKQAIAETFDNVDVVFLTSRQQAKAYFDECSSETGCLPQLVLLDLYAPKREDGWAILEYVRTLPGPVAKLTIVMLSSSEATDDVSEAYDRGCNSYIQKPTDFSAWFAYFQSLKMYWQYTATIPNTRYV